jgi:hypothetical protein
MRTPNRVAALVLVLVTPLVAELAFSTPLRMAWLVLLWLPIYGAGILLVRELVRRAGRGWPSILLLGFAYELIEDGIGLQALSSPHLYHAADWGARVLGLNLPYWEVNAIYHMVFSAAIPILLVDLMFPSHRDLPYLKNFGLIVTAIVALLGLGLLRVSVPLSQDPGYVAPIWVLVGTVVAVIVLGVVALRVLPRRSDPRTTGHTAPGNVPALPVLWAAGAVGAIAVLGLLFPFGNATQPSFTRGWWVLVPMVVAAVLTGIAYVLVRRWTAAPGWTDRHALALAGGALVGHSLVGAAAANTVFDQIGLVVIAIVTAALVLLLDSRIRRRDGATEAAWPAGTSGAVEHPSA